MAYVLKNQEDQPLMHNGGPVFMTLSTEVVKGVDMNKRTLNMTGTAEVKDRDGDIVVATGGDLANYMKNPVFLWSHTYSGPASVPLGKTIQLIKRKNPARLDFTIQFSSLGLNPFADMILALYNEKIINASSIGFIPREWEKLEDGEGADDMFFYRGRKFTKWELLELSGCAVPANPAALQHAIKGYAHPQTTENDRKSIYQILIGEKVLDLKTSGVDELELKAELDEMQCEIQEIDDSKVMVQVPVDVVPTPSENVDIQGVDNTEKNEYISSSGDVTEKTEETEMSKETQPTENTEKVPTETDSETPIADTPQVDSVIALVSGLGEVIVVDAKEFVKLLIEKNCTIEVAPQKESTEEVPSAPTKAEEENEDLAPILESLKNLQKALRGN